MTARALALFDFPSRQNSLMTDNSLFIQAETLQNLLIATATGGSEPGADYAELRRALIGNLTVSGLLPRFVHTNRSLGQFWQFIKYEYASYAERREYIWKEFQPLLDFLERGGIAPADKFVTGILGKYDAEHVQAAWSKALERRASDAEGAITSARTLLESVCKHILDEESISYNDKDDLPKLYQLTSKQLNIAPSQHTEEVFRQILGGVTAAVEGLGTLRNRLSDAHGKGRIAAKPKARHAELAVNLSGALAMFVLQTWEEKKGKGT
jgi:uncharacterized protein YfkK (UPF0435 family)